MKTDPLRFEAIPIEKPENTEIICGQGTFNLLAIEDLHRAVAVGSPSAKFGIAFNEGSDDALIRKTGNDKSLTAIACQNMKNISCGHCFIVIFQDAFPIQIINNIKSLQTVVSIKVASGNPTVAIVARTGNSSALLGVADGSNPIAIESLEQEKQRKKLVRQFGYLPKS